MKITVCGKGGCGKSTITTLLAKELARQGQKVLVIDSDESNYGLHRQLGMELPRDFTEYFGGKNTAFKRMITSGILEQAKLSAFAKKFFSEDFALADIPEEYCERKDGVTLMSSGKIHKANEGCACVMNGVIEQFVTHLKLGKNETALLDMEAGVEHFGRGTDNGADKIVMIVDPSYESLRLSGKVKELAESIGKPVCYVLNKVTEENRELMMESVAAPEAVVACIPLSREISEAGLRGETLEVREAEVELLAKSLL